MLIPFGVLSAAGAGGFEGIPAYDLISTTVLASTSASITFSSLGTYSADYKHLQLRMVPRDNFGGEYTVGYYLRFNGDTGTNYNIHRFLGTGASVLSLATANTSLIQIGLTAASLSPTSAFSGTVADILDPFSTTKNTTTRSLSGNAIGTGQIVEMNSGHWRNTSSVTSITIFSEAASVFQVGSRFSLYGIKGE
jgi:hypothetical protein